MREQWQTTEYIVVLRNHKQPRKVGVNCDFILRICKWFMFFSFFIVNVQLLIIIQILTFPVSFLLSHMFKLVRVYGRFHVECIVCLMYALISIDENLLFACTYVDFLSCGYFMWECVMSNILGFINHLDTDLWSCQSSQLKIGHVISIGSLFCVKLRNCWSKNITLISIVKVIFRKM